MGCIRPDEIGLALKHNGLRIDNVGVQMYHLRMQLQDNAKRTREYLKKQHDEMRRMFMETRIYQRQIIYLRERIDKETHFRKAFISDSFVFEMCMLLVDTPFAVRNMIFLFGDF